MNPFLSANAAFNQDFATQYFHPHRCHHHCVIGIMVRCITVCDDFQRISSIGDQEVNVRFVVTEHVDVVFDEIVYKGFNNDRSGIEHRVLFDVLLCRVNALSQAKIGMGGSLVSKCGY